VTLIMEKVQLCDFVVDTRRRKNAQGHIENAINLLIFLASQVGFVMYRRVPGLGGSFCDILLVGAYVCEHASLFFQVYNHECFIC
jgi:hypothetical protein